MVEIGNFHSCGFLLFQAVFFRGDEVRDPIGAGADRSSFGGKLRFLVGGGLGAKPDSPLGKTLRCVLFT